MENELTIKEVKVSDTNYCVGCFLENDEDIICDYFIDLAIKQGLNTCGAGYIYKIKDKDGE